MADSGYQGTMEPDNSIGDYNGITLLIWDILNKVNTATMVKVVSVTNTGGVAAAGNVDVQPLVNLLDGQDRTVERPVIYSLPYFRIMGGSNAVIIDPEVGDIGIAIFDQRDISKVKSTQKQSNPGSSRRFNISDGLYIGGFLGAAPSQYVQMNSSGINIVSPTEVTVKAPSIKLSNGGSLQALLNAAFSTWAAGHSHAALGAPPTVSPDSTMQTSIVTAE